MLIREELGMIVYLDNSATTKVLDSVKDIVVETMVSDYGNPSSMHKKGLDAENYVKDARTRLAKLIKVEEKEILFTSGGTESNNLALIGTAVANQRAGKHLITSCIEHPSVTNVMKYLEEEGFQVTYLPVDSNGLVDLEQLADAIREDTILISIMYVNNEIGTVEPIEEIAKVIKRKKPDVLFHVDAIQAFGKYRIYPKRIGIDLLSVSGHKIHGPKGSGFLYIRSGVKIRPILLGGGQQKGMRSGTENVPAIAGLGQAAEEVYQNLEQKVEKLYKLKACFIEGIERMDGVCVHGFSGYKGAPHIVSVGFSGVRSEVLLHALEERGIFVSAGSACSSNKATISATLKGIGVKKEYLDSTIRFSFSIFTTEEEIAYCLSILEEILVGLRRYARK